MTDFAKVKHYYKNYDEWNRTFIPEGRLEFDQTIDVIKKYTKASWRILDLGGDPGRYTYELAQSGRIMSLGDISPELVSIAKEKTKGISNIESIQVVNAINLECYRNEYFDAVLYMGPLYHLTDDNEIMSSLKEVYRVLKLNGTIIASFIPILSGTASIIARSIVTPTQVTAENLNNTITHGIFNNNAESGFQEGKYLSSTQVRNMMNKSGFRTKIVRSVRGLGNKLEKGIYDKKENDKEIFNSIMEVIEKTVEDEAVINMCGHALFIGEKIA